MTDQPVMTTILPAGPPIETQRNAVGRSTSLLVDSERGDRTLGIDCWYPAADGDHARSVYELLPQIGFTSAAFADAPGAPGPHPLVVWSHGRSGTRSSYALLCEGLAARGYIVIAPDHPGDTLADWLLGAAVDDATNEAQRVDDMRFVLDAALGIRAGLAVPAVIDTDRIAVAGHSYGAYTALALAGADPYDARIGAVAGMQSLTRTIPRRVLGRIAIPSLLVSGGCDVTTPADTDADRAFEAIAAIGGDARRVDVEQAGHQACSDVGMYLELAPRIVGLPDLIVDFVQSMAADITGRAGDPWRPTVGLHLRLLGAWLDDVLDRDREPARRELDDIGQTAGVTVQRAASA